MYNDPGFPSRGEAIERSEAMFVLYADKTQLTVRAKEPITSGSVNAFQAQFEFSADWNGLGKTAVFQAGCRSWSVLLEDGGMCSIPWEALEHPGCHLFAGVYGCRGTDLVELVLPTIWADLGTVLEGAAPGEEAQPPTPELWQQELAKKGDRLAYTETGELGLYAGGKVLSSVPVEGGGGIAYQFGHGLKVTGRTVSVDTVDGFEGDNTLPMTAAGVYATVGNIEALLGTI